MKARVEQLPVEIWLSIFSYFEVHELFHGFSNLNRYFDSLIASEYLSLNVRLKKTDEYLFNKIRLNRIVYLQSTIWHLSDGFPRFFQNHIQEFNRLKSLKLHISTSQTNIICQVLQTLNTIEYLSLRCRITVELLQAIIAASKLRVCQLEFYKFNESNYYPSDTPSNIQALYINISNESDYRILNLLLTNISKLKRLEILNYDYDYSDSTVSFLRQSFSFSELRIVKLTWNFKYIQKNFFESLIKTIPMLKQFYFDVYCQYLNEAFFTNLINHWWLIITKIEKIEIFIRGNVDFSDNPSSDTWKQVDDYRKNLLSRNDEFDQRFKITWNQNNSSGWTYLEIVIQSTK